MSCPHSRVLVAHASGMRAEQDVAEHLAICGHCAKDAAHVTAIAHHIGAPSEFGEFVDPALQQSIMARLTLQKDTPARSRWFFVPWRVPRNGDSQPNPAGLFADGFVAPPRNMLDIPSSSRLALDKNSSRHSTTNHRSWGLVLAVPAAVALLLFVRPQEESRAFVARGGATDTDPDAWVSISVFRMQNGSAVPVTDSIRAADALVFAYDNRNARYDALLVFGVDDHGSVHWYYPAHSDPTADPESTHIGAGATVRLPDAVTHALGPGALRLFAVFGEEPLRVQYTEEIVRAALATTTLEALNRLPITDTGQHSLLLRVEP